MNNDEYSKIQSALGSMPKNGIGKKNVTESDLVKMVNSMDKSEITKKLNSMGLSFISEKLKNTSNEEIAKMLKNNPALIDKINNYLK